MQGVAITLLVKNADLTPGVWFGDVWGRRLEKYKICAYSKYRTLATEYVKPASPFYFLSPHSLDLAWLEHRSLDEIFLAQSTGMLTARDGFNVAFHVTLLQRLRRFVSLDPNIARNGYKLGPDTRDGKVELAQDDLREAGVDPRFLRRVTYRPFDEQVVFYTGKSKGLIGQPGKPLADAVDVSDIALGTIRRVEEGDFRHAFVCSRLLDGHSVSSKETTHAFPLFLPE